MLMLRLRCIQEFWKPPPVVAPLGVGPSLLRCNGCTEIPLWPRRRPVAARFENAPPDDSAGSLRSSVRAGLRREWIDTICEAVSLPVIRFRAQRFEPDAF